MSVDVMQAVVHSATADTLQLMPGVSLLHSEDWVQVRFEQARRVLSSAILNGGICTAQNFLNLRVAKHAGDSLEEPAQTLQRVSEQLECPGTTVGMMTAASMNSLRFSCEKVDGQQLAVLVTTGLENARRAGDPADYPGLYDTQPERGTINLAVVSDARLADHALVEMVSIATEAKAAVLQELDIRSPLSGGLATGTGTDAIAVFSGHGERQVEYAGKHTLLGERLAVMVMQVIRASVAYKEVPATCA